MPETSPPLHTWQLFHAYRKVLGDSMLQKIYQRGLRQLQRWSADPRFASDVERNPLDRLEIVLDRLVEIGRADLAVATVSRLARIVNHRLIPEETEIVPDKRDWRDEIIDDYPAITSFHCKCRAYRENNGDPEEVEVAHDEAVRELTETKISVLQGKDKMHPERKKEVAHGSIPRNL